MYTEKQLERLFGKLKNYELSLEARVFYVVDSVPMRAFPTDGSHFSVPDDACFVPCEDGARFTGDGAYCWFKGEYTVKPELDGKDIFVWPKIKGYEGMLYVDGKPYGNFAAKILVNCLNNHYCDLLKQNVKAGETIPMAFEYYAHHTNGAPGADDSHCVIEYHPVDICLKDDLLCEFYFDLKVCNQMVNVLDPKDFRRADFVQALIEVHKIISYDIDNEEPEVVRQQMIDADKVLKRVLSSTNSASAAYAGLIGHSHMDTAWLWQREETVKKCARTYSNQMNLMDQYPEYTFVQPASYHAYTIKENYPELFEDIKRRVAEGRYEPNGGAWIESDCNIPTGEYLIRQFVWGQRFTRDNYNYTSDAFWLPDTFGYSAAIPQILKGCNIDYFMSTKLAWNDTNIFPYDSFYWKGIDGTKVLAHFNCTDKWPDPESFAANILEPGHYTVKERAASRMRLLSYGFGDGGGGPEFNMIEVSRRMKDLEGMPRSSYTTVSKFMHQLENHMVDPSTYTGELYLEIHRGTLTNQHTIKRNNRKAESALHDLEYITVRDAITRGDVASHEKIDPLTGEMLVNQFHDILPGTCIAPVHDRAIRDVTNIISQSGQQIQAMLAPYTDAASAVTLVNTLSFTRKGVVYLPFTGKYVAGGFRQQVITDMDGNKKLAVLGVEIPAFGSVVLTLTDEQPEAQSVFTAQDNLLDTPAVKVAFNEKGYLASYVDKATGRELKGEGYALNTLLMAEELSWKWDSWDIDADFECKLADTAKLLSHEVVADGAVEYRIRSRYQLSAKSTLEQDMIFYADSPMVVFETRMNWQDAHRFLKVAFDTSIHAEFSSHEIQFGYVRRVTNRNTSHEKAKFEAVNHRYSDLSEPRYGAAVLNDCKYGVSTKDSSIWLSLHKGGMSPDWRGDKGVHDCTYAFLPHEGALGAGNVIEPAYVLNKQPIILEGSLPMESLLTIDTDHVIVETVKPAENQGRSFILRVYEAEGSAGSVTLNFSFPVKGLTITNMLEDVQQELAPTQQLTMSFRPFEIKTIRVDY